MERMVSKKFIDGSIKSVVMLLLTVVAFNNCNKSDKQHDGALLNEFAIDDIGLKSIVDSVIEKHLPILQSDKKKQVMSLNLSQRDSTLLFIFSLRNQDEIVNKYIYWCNIRIVGYTISRDVEVLLLSDIDDMSELGRRYGRFIHPTGIFRTFDYIKFPKDIYIGDHLNTWPEYELVYDPTYIVYPYENNTFLLPQVTKNPVLVKFGDSSE